MIRIGAPSSPATRACRAHSLEFGSGTRPSGRRYPHIPGARFQAAFLRQMAETTARPSMARGSNHRSASTSRMVATLPDAIPGIELHRAGLVVIDPDRHHDGPDGVAAFAALEAENGGIPAHPETDTAGGGKHLFFVSLRASPSAISAVPFRRALMSAAPEGGSLHQGRCGPTVRGGDPRPARNRWPTPIAAAPYIRCPPGLAVRSRGIRKNGGRKRRAILIPLAVVRTRRPVNRLTQPRA